MKELPETLGKAEFARFINRGPSYVTALRKEGRLVMDGDRVKVRESLERMAKTRGARDDVAARWAALAGSEVPEVVQGADRGSPAPSGEQDDGSWRESRAQSEARKSKAQAEQEEMKAAQMRGDLIAREDVDAAFRGVGAAARAAIKVLADQLAPVVAPVTDLNEVHALIVEAEDNTLERFGQELKRQQDELAKAGKK